MYVLVLFAVMMTQDGPVPVTRPSIEYYKTEAECKKLGVQHLKDFMKMFENEPPMFAAKCVEVTHEEGDPA